MRLRRSPTTLAAAGLLLVAPLVMTAPAAAAPGHAPDSGSRLIGGIDVETATIPELQDAMNHHRLTSTGLTVYYLDQIRRLNPDLHAVIEVNRHALAQAIASDVRHLTHHTRGPMDGIPILLKDNITTRRQPATAGSEALEHARADHDAFLAARLRDAGAVIIGKANLSEWANFRSSLSSSGWSGVGGQTNNPYVLDRNPCGSSSGTGSGVSAHLATVGIGTETDGSIVCPSGQNGLVGIKPTLGLVSRSGIVPISAQQDTAGPMTRNVTDAAVLLSVLTGVDPEDPATAESAGHIAPDYTDFLDADALAGKRIGVWSDVTGGDPETDAVFANFIEELRAAGATPVEVSLPYQDIVGQNEFPALLNEFKHDLNANLAATPGRHPADLAGLIEFNNEHADTELAFFGQDIFEQAQATSGDLTDPTYLEQRHAATDAARRSIDETMATFDLDAIAAPTNSPAWKTTLGSGDNFVFGSSAPAAVAGYPSVVVPAGFSGPLPIGVSIIGGQWDEPNLIGLAYSYEQATHHRRAPTFIPSIG